MVFLETTVDRAEEKAENQQKTRKKSKVAENQVLWLEKRTVHTPSGQDGGGEGEGGGAAGPQQAEATRGRASLSKIH